MRGILAMLAVTAGSTTALAAPAEDQVPILRCFVVSGIIARSTNPDQAQAGRLAGVYWMGRLDPSLTEVDIERKVKQMSATIKVPELQQDVPRCAAEMKARGDMMKRVGDKIRESLTPAEKR